MSTMKLTGWEGMLSVASEQDKDRKTPESAPAVQTSSRESAEEVKGEVLAPCRMSRVMLSEAAERSLRNLNVCDEEADILRALVVNDIAGPVSEAYHSARFAHAKSSVSIAKQEITIRYRLNDDQIAAINSYAKEYNIRYLNRDRHDHAAAAAMRIIDHKLIASRVPNGVKMSDVGGNPLHHISHANAHVHVCGHVHDKKDQMRNVMRHQAVKKKLGDSNTAISNMAQKYLDKDKSFVCFEDARFCLYPTPVITSVHVYDIPLDHWPMIMEHKQAMVVEGCMIHSKSIFNTTSGDLVSIGARYEIDVKSNTFKMGFINSSSWWYEHNLADYLAYGVDQIIVHRNQSYSYKVVERRGDTIFFRFIKLDGDVYAPKSVKLSLPGLPMVKVAGIELAEGQTWSGLVRKEYRFPRNLWYELVAQASEDYERGALDYYRMYNHYRTMSVKSTVNSILVMGGEVVDSEELRPLIVHACLAATAASILGQRESRVMTDMISAIRMKGMQSVFTKFFSAVVTVVKAALGVVLEPIAMIGRGISQLSADSLAELVMDWAPEVSEITIETLPLLAKVNPGNPNKDDVFHGVDQAAQDLSTVAPILTIAREKPLRLLCKALMGIEDEETALAEVESTSTSTKKPFDGNSEISETSDSASCTHNRCETLDTSQQNDIEPAVDESVHRERIRAIEEHIVEIQQMQNAVVATSRKAYTQLCISSPNKNNLTAYAEIFENPDLWHVVNGVVAASVRGVELSEFDFQVVYHPKFGMNGEQPLRIVKDAVYEGPDPSGNQVKRVHKVLSDSSFSGYVLTTDSMRIFNGDKILESLRAALLLRHDYEVQLEEGPPGCGKTYSIIQQFNKTTDAVMCPVRESIEDTRDRVVGTFGLDFKQAKKYICTFDSYLVNRSKSSITRRRLLADECFMAHSGKIYATAALIGARVVRAFGDSKQIPHIPRVDVPHLFVRLKAQHTTSVWKTHRCPANAVAAFGSVYDWRVRTASKVQGTLKMVHDINALVIPKGAVLMCMKQCDKLKLQHDFHHRKDVKVITAHESEGKTYKHVILFRFDTRICEDRINLYNREPYVLVAMSRHTHSFTYYCQVDPKDLVSKWIARAGDVRRIAAASDLDSIGTQKQFH